MSKGITPSKTCFAFCNQIGVLFVKKTKISSVNENLLAAKHRLQCFANLSMF